jgi:hypothetical protein
MDIVRGATRVVTRTANATTAAAGAIGGAAINGVVGGVEGTAGGIRNGLSSGSHSTPAALLTLGAVGATGLLEWPVVLAVGGTALLVRQLTRQNSEVQDSSSDLVPATRGASTSSSRSGPAEGAGKAAKAPARKAARSRTSG